jgi:hypothetical protein
MLRARVLELCKRFSERRDEIEIDSPPGCLTYKIRWKRRKCENSGAEWSTTYCQIDGRRTEYRYTVQLVLTENSGMKEGCAKMVPEILDDDQLQRRKEVCSLRRCFAANLWKAEQNHHLEWKLVFSVWPWDKAAGHAMEISVQTTAQENSDVEIQVKTVMICFFDCESILHRELVPAGETSTQKFYLQALDRLRQRVRRMRPELFPGRWVLHQDNASSYTSSHQGVFGAKLYHSPEPPSFLTRSRSTWLVPLLYDDE